MADPSVTFLSYNSTGMNTLKSRWLRDLINLTKASFVQVQEHFKSNKNIDQFFVEQFPDHSTFVKPAHREKHQDSGRAKGGIAQLKETSLDIKTNRIKNSSFRIQAQILDFPTVRLLWINAYLPPDPQLVNYDQVELQTILNEVETMMDDSNYDEVIFGGDFNWDKSRNSGFAACLDRWVDRVGLVDIWDKFSADYTHVHTDLKSFSTLDRFLVSPGLLPCITSAGPLHLGDNPSRHSPIMMKISVGSLPRKKPSSMTTTRRPAWYKASEADINTFTYRLHERLEDLIPPPELDCQDPHCDQAEHLQVRDSYLLDVLVAMIETSHETIPMGGGKMKKWDPDKKCEVGSAIPGWRENLEPLRQDSLFWHAMWQQNGKPNRGQLYELMKYVRNKYHYAVHKAKKLANSVRAKELFEHAQLGDVNLLKEMKKIKGGKKQTAACPDNIDDAHSADEVSELFKTVYEELYNSAESVNAMAEIKNKLNDLIDVNSLAEVHRVTGAAVKEACVRMKPGKADVTGSYTSDILLHGPDSLFDHLARIFRSFLVHGDVTLQLLSCAFLPLFKGGLKNPHSSDSYRAIAMSSQILKLLDNVILLLWGDLLGSDSLQFGFKKGTSTTQCSWLVMEVASYYLRQGSPVIATLLDCSKAFDKCVYSSLFTKLLEKEVPPIVIRVLVCVYEEQQGCVTWSGVRSSSFPIRNGTRQGSVLSPCLFSVYVDDLLKRLRHLGLGCHMGGMWVGAAGYADDLILLAPSRTAMQQMLNVCFEYAAEFNLKFSTDPNPNLSKTKCLYMCGHMGQDYPLALNLGDHELPWVEHASHLGHELHQMCNMDFDATVKRAQFIEQSVQIQECFGFAHPNDIMRAVHIYAGHGYGAMLWDLFGDKAKQVYNSWNTCAKITWGVPRATHTYIMDNLLGSQFFTVKQQLLGRYVSFVQQLLKSSSPEVCVVGNMVTRCARSNTGKNLVNIQRECKTDPLTTKSWRIRADTPRTGVPALEGWRLQYLRKLIFARMDMDTQCKDIEEISTLIDTLCTT